VQFKTVQALSENKIIPVPKQQSRSAINLRVYCAYETHASWNGAQSCISVVHAPQFQWSSLQR